MGLSWKDNETHRICRKAGEPGSEKGNKKSKTQEQITGSPVLAAEMEDSEAWEEHTKYLAQPHVIPWAAGSLA